MEILSEAKNDRLVFICCEILSRAKNDELMFIYSEWHLAFVSIERLASKLTEINSAYFPVPVEAIQGNLYAICSLLAGNMHCYLLMRLSGAGAVK